MNRDQTDYVTEKLNGIMDAIKACDEVPDEEGFCSCACHIRDVLAREVEMRDAALFEIEWRAIEDRAEEELPEMINEAMRIKTEVWAAEHGAEFVASNRTESE